MRRIAWSKGLTTTALCLVLMGLRESAKFQFVWAQSAPPTATRILESADNGGDQLPDMGVSQDHFPGLLSDFGRMGLYARSSFNSTPKTDPVSGETIIPNNYAGVYLAQTSTSTSISKVAVWGDAVTANVGADGTRSGTMEIAQFFPGIGFATTDAGNQAPFNNAGEFVFEGRLVVPITNQFGSPDFNYYTGIFSLSNGQFTLRVLRASENNESFPPVNTVGPIYGADVSFENVSILQINDNHNLAIVLTDTFVQTDKLFFNETPVDVPAGGVQSLKINNQDNVALILRNKSSALREVYFNTTRLFGVGDSITGFGTILDIRAPIALNDNNELAVMVEALNSGTGLVEPTVLTMQLLTNPGQAGSGAVALGSVVPIRFPTVSFPAIGSPHAFNSSPHLLLIGTTQFASGTVGPGLLAYHIDFGAGTAELVQSASIADLHQGAVTTAPYFGAINSLNQVGYSINMPRVGVNQGTYLATLSGICECCQSSIQEPEPLPLSSIPSTLEAALATVKQLEALGEIRIGFANSLLAKLVAARDDALRGNYRAARGVLEGLAGEIGNAAGGQLSEAAVIALGSVLQSLESAVSSGIGLQEEQQRDKKSRLVLLGPPVVATPFSVPGSPPGKYVLQLLDPNPVNLDGRQPFVPRAFLGDEKLKVEETTKLLESPIQPSFADDKWTFTVAPKDREGTAKIKVTLETGKESFTVDIDIPIVKSFIPLNLCVVLVKNQNGGTPVTLDEFGGKRVDFLSRINKIWAPSGIVFKIKSVEEKEIDSKFFRDDGTFNRDVPQGVVDDLKKSLAANCLWLFLVNDMKGAGFTFGLGPSFVKTCNYDLVKDTGRVSAHELGHQLRLGDIDPTGVYEILEQSKINFTGKNLDDLMGPQLIDQNRRPLPSGILLTDKQTEVSRKRAGELANKQNP